MIGEESNKSIIKTPAISREAKNFNGLATDSIIQGIKTAAFLDRQITEMERNQRKSKANPVKEDIPVPTGTEIRKAREEGEYR